MRFTSFIAISCAVLGAAATPSFAADPAQDGYNTMPIQSVPPASGQGGEQEGQGVAGANSTDSGSGPAGAPAGSGVAGASGSSAPVATASAPVSASGATLPFTGLDVGLIAGAALLLMGLGLALRRSTRTE